MADFGRSGDELTAKQAAAALALASSYTINEAAKAAGVSERALRRWRRQPAFRRALREALAVTFSDGLRLLVSDQQRNLTELLSLRSKADDPAIRLRAALGLEAALSRRFELAMLADMAARLDDLEAALATEADNPGAGETA